MKGTFEVHKVCKFKGRQLTYDLRNIITIEKEEIIPDDFPSNIESEKEREGFVVSQSFSRSSIDRLARKVEIELNVSLKRHSLSIVRFGQSAEAFPKLSRISLREQKAEGEGTAKLS